MTKEEKEKLSQYAKLFCDFVNTKTTDDILISLFRNLQNTFHFSSDFKEKGLHKFKESFSFVPQQDFYNYINETQKFFRSIILQIINTEQSYKDKNFSLILNEYNSIPKTKLTIVKDHSLIDESPINEEFFIYNTSSAKRDNKVILLTPALIFCLVEYLKAPGFHGREKLSVCKKCNNIFSKSKLNSQQKYCSECSRKNKMTKEARAAYQRDYNKILKERKAKEKKRKLEKEISNLIAQGTKPKEARELAILKLKDK